ncbi:RsfA family transcriptional regulator [Salicibibacter halophilus]|uniref:RsfA family transcriptional regulator n=1 Tax=Salicibibacter halophilus TaxID=2502791 RepID=A0A514LMQ0_9BACI|nr:RsfA family transcriptional regulator [Salicibibacter halophilus]QDI92835.1 RsfA family transcriptional regulator [Salicibibacter halophilus]
MTKVRQDAWSHEDDVLLAETVLKHIKEGSTQLKAFEEVGDILNRTAAACGFRWNAVVRDRYDGQISDAKRERKNFQRQDAANAVQQTLGMKTANRMETTTINNAYAGNDEELSLEQVIVFLETLKNKQGNAGIDQEKVTALEEENKQLQTAVNAWRYKHKELDEEYQSLLTVINRARKMMFMDETNTDSFLRSNDFRLDQEGNIENIANDSG